MNACVCVSGRERETEREREREREREKWSTHVCVCFVCLRECLRMSPRVSRRDTSDGGDGSAPVKKVRAFSTERNMSEQRGVHVSSHLHLTSGTTGTTALPVRTSQPRLSHLSDPQSFKTPEERVLLQVIPELYQADLEFMFTDCYLQLSLGFIITSSNGTFGSNYYIIKWNLQVATF